MVAVRNFNSYAVKDPQVKKGEWGKLPQAVLYNLCQISDMNWYIITGVGIISAIIGRGICGKKACLTGLDISTMGIITALFGGGMLLMKRTGVCK